MTARAEAALQAKQFDIARDAIQRLERIRTPTPADRLLRARIDVAAGDDEQALAELRTIVDDPKLATKALYLTGLIERSRYRSRYAEAAYRKAIALDPSLVQVRRELIYILGMQSRRHDLDAEFKALARVAPLSRYDLYIWCLTHFINWDSDSAEDLQKFVEADPEDRESRLSVARLILGQPGREDQVEEVLASLPKDDPEVLAIRIEKELSRGRIDQAMAMIERTESDDPHLARLRGRIAMRRGDAETAVRYFRQALSDEPYDRISNSELGKALMLLGNRDEARKYLDRSQHLDEVYNLVTSIGKPKQEISVETLHRLGRVCESAGLFGEARGWYMLAIEKNPLDQEAQQAIHRLRPATGSPESL